MMNIPNGMIIFIVINICFMEHILILNFLGQKNCVANLFWWWSLIIISNSNIKQEILLIGSLSHMKGTQS